MHQLIIDNYNSVKFKIAKLLNAIEMKKTRDDMKLNERIIVKFYKAITKVIFYNLKNEGSRRISFRETIQKIR